METREAGRNDLKKTRLDRILNKINECQNCVSRFINENSKALTLLLVLILVLIIVILCGLLESIKVKSSSINRAHHIQFINLTEQASINSQEIVDKKQESFPCGIVLRNSFKRIVNGVNVRINKWPWVVSLNKRNSTGNTLRHFCSGAVISNSFILTAAHCFNSFKADEVVVVINDRSFLVDKLVLHKSYKFTTYAENDIALVKLQNILSNDTIGVSPICLPENKSQSDSIIQNSVIVASLAEEKGSNKILQDVELEIVNGNRICDSSGFFDQNILYCALDTNKTRASNLCDGDSGSPLFTKLNSNFWVLFGIASYVTADNKTGVFECVPSLPSYFTKVAMYLDWIKLNMN